MANRDDVRGRAGADNAVLSAQDAGDGALYGARGQDAKQTAADMSKVLNMELAPGGAVGRGQRGRQHRGVPRRRRRRRQEQRLRTLFGVVPPPPRNAPARYHPCWFLLDIAYYSQNLFQKDIFSAIGWFPEAATMDALEEIFRIARAQTLIALCGTVPVYWFTVAFIDRLGRFLIQLGGFLMMTAFRLAIPYHHWATPGNQIGFVVMYAFTFFFANFGPNSTTFIVPAEIFRARVRSTCHGISAAAGKLGAIVGSFGFLYLAQIQDPKKVDHEYSPDIGMGNSLFVLAACNILGLVCTFLVPESKGKAEVNEAAAPAPADDNSLNRTLPVWGLKKNIEPFVYFF